MLIGVGMRCPFEAGEERGREPGRRPENHTKEDRTMKDTLITITGLNFRFGSDFLKKGMKVKLVKEPENEFDKEAIRVELKGLGTIGYVANSTKTVAGESISAGRLYDRIGKKAKAKVMIKLDNAVICKVSKKSMR